MDVHVSDFSTAALPQKYNIFTLLGSPLINFFAAFWDFSYIYVSRYIFNRLLYD